MEEAPLPPPDPASGETERDMQSPDAVLADLMPPSDASEVDTDEPEVVWHLLVGNPY